MTPTNPESAIPMPTPPTARPGISQRAEPSVPFRATVSSTSAWPAPNIRAATRRVRRAPNLCRTRGGVPRADHVGQRHRHEDRAGCQRSETPTLLEIEREHQEVRRHAAEEGRDGDQPGGDRPAGRFEVHERQESAALECPCPTRARPPSTTALASRSQVHAGQPRSRPSISGNTSAVSVATTRALSRRSGRGTSTRGSGSSRRAATSATRPTGTLIRKIDRQPNPARLRSISSPPSSCPETAASPITVA